MTKAVQEEPPGKACSWNLPTCRDSGNSYNFDMDNAGAQGRFIFQMDEYNGTLISVHVLWRWKKLPTNEWGSSYGVDGYKAAFCHHLWAAAVNMKSAMYAETRVAKPARHFRRPPRVSVWPPGGPVWWQVVLDKANQGELSFGELTWPCGRLAGNGSTTSKCHI